MMNGEVIVPPYEKYALPPPPPDPHAELAEVKSPPVDA
jgi:hypothetical protein